MQITTQRREPASGKVISQVEPIDPATTVILIIDPWEYHWCITWCGLAGGRIPRLDRAMRCARELGFTIIHCPTDVAFSYVAAPQRQPMAALPRLPMPKVELNVPPFPEGEGGPRSRHCMCTGTHCCTPHYGLTANDPRLIIDQRDLIAADGVEVHAWCKTHGITHVIITGFATNICMAYKPEGLVHLTAAGMRCVFARDLTEGYGSNTGAASADRYTAACVEHLEKHVGASIDLVAELRKAGKWLDQWIVDPVRIVPWGQADRRCMFDQSVEVSMTFPLHLGAQLRYTLDGGEPTLESPLYQRPITLERSGVVRAAAFVNGKAVSLPTECHYVRRPTLPAKPDIYLSDVRPGKIVMAHWCDIWSEPLKGSEPPPQIDRSYSGGPLTLHGVRYGRGISAQVPVQLLYELKPEYARFVAIAGLDEAVLLRDLGRSFAAQIRAEFLVYIDGRLAASSPAMRLGVAPWRFDVAIPPGSKTLGLVATNPQVVAWNHANWVDAGFVTR